MKDEVYLIQLHQIMKTEPMISARKVAQAVLLNAKNDADVQPEEFGLLEQARNCWFG